MRYRKKRQNDSPVATLLMLSALGLVIGIDQAKSGLIAISAVILAAAAAYFVVVYMRNKQHQEHLVLSGIQDIDKMSGLDFEKYLQALLLRKGYVEVKLTHTYDLGVDITAKKDGEYWAIQAKRYKGKVGLDSVRQVVTAAKYYKCSRTMVITNSFYTSNARTIARTMDCVLIDRDQLVSMILA